MRPCVHSMHSVHACCMQTDRVLIDSLSGSLNGRIPRAPLSRSAEYFFWDKSHPTDGGHKVLAELLAGALLRALGDEAQPGEAARQAGLTAWPKGSRLPQAHKAALPPPMIHDNVDASTTLCAIQVCLEGWGGEELDDPAAGNRLLCSATLYCRRRSRARW